MTTPIFVAVFLLLAFIVLVVQAKARKAAKAKRKNRVGTFRRRELMSDNEREFFGRLVAALPDHFIFPQVALSALIESSSGERYLANGDRLRIAQQRADYVVCNRMGEVVAVVELDDRTHSASKDQLRDSRLEQAGIRTIRFESRSKPTPATIRVTVCGAAPVVEQTKPTPTAVSA